MHSDGINGRNYPYLGSNIATVLDPDVPLVRSRAMARTAPDAATFGAAIAAAYATKGGAVELGTGMLEGRARARGGSPPPPRDDEPPRPDRRRDRHRKDADAPADRRAALGRRRRGVHGRREGRRLRHGRPRLDRRPGEEASDRARAPLHPDRLPGRVPVARRDRPRRAGARDGLRLRPAPAGEGARLERDPGAEPRARLPLRRREGPPAPRPLRPARAAHVPRLGRAAGRAEGNRRPLAADGRRPPALARRPRDGRRERVLRRAAARRRRPPAHRAGRARRHLVPRAPRRPGQADALVDGAHVARRGALRAASRGRRSRQAAARLLPRRGAPPVRGREQGVRRVRRCRPCA